MRKKCLRFLKQNNEGAAIVIVIVAMAFVGVLASTIMWMSLVNFRMKVTDRKIKESFYSAETVFEQMSVGLQNLAAESADAAYSFIMQNYANFPEDKRNSEFQKEYMKSVQEALAKSASETDQYDLQKLMLYVDAGMRVGIVDPSSSKSWIGARSLDASLIGTANEYKSRYGAIVAPVDADYLLLKGLHLEYTDSEGFLTIIDTDLMITTPEADFTQSGRVANAFDYALIADDSLDNTLTSGFVSVNGNMYVGANGIHTKNRLTVSGADYLISKGEVLLENTGALIVGKPDESGKTPEFWADGVTIDKNVVSGSELYLNAHSYVHDDLTVNGSSAKVTLGESYYGYGDSDTEVENSSAIIVNGINNTIDMSALEQFLLAGRAFTSVKGKSVADPNSLGEKTVEIPTGESIAIKGDQIAYLVPDECIGVFFGDSLFAKNPLSGDEYAQIQEYKNNPEYASSFKEVDINRQLEIYGGKSLASYGINETSGIEKAFIPSNGETLVYYYLKFASPRDAERFFKDFYELHKEKLDRYTGIYAAGGIRSEHAYTRITVAGNYFNATADGANGNTVSLKDPVDSVAAVNELQKETESYRHTFEGLTTALTTNYLSLTAQEKARKEVFPNLLDVDALKAYLGGSRKTFTLEDGYKGILTDEDPLPGDGNDAYVYDGDDKIVLIIATGDVTVKGEFKGIIMSGGKVTLDTGAKIISAKNADRMSELVRILQMTHSEIDQKKPLDFVRNADQYILAGTALTKDEDEIKKQEWADFSEFVKYQNWTKR